MEELMLIILIIEVGLPIVLIGMAVIYVILRKND
jgi:hypothetical protein